MRKKRIRKNKSRKTHHKRGGGIFDFFTGKSTVVADDCDAMKLTQLKSSQEMRTKYQQCCPKKYFGMVKNTSPYCKQLDLNFKGAVEREGLQKQYVGMEEPLEVAQMQNAPMLPAAPALPVQTEYPQVNQSVGGRMKRMKRRTRRRYLKNNI